MKKGLLVSIIFLLVGIVLCGLAIYSYVGYESLNGSAIKMTGTVSNIKWDCAGGIDCQNVSDPSLAAAGNKDWSGYPVVTFKTMDGQSVSFTSDVGGNPAPYRIGQTVPILYSSENPSDAQIVGTIWLKLFILGILGVISFCIGLLGTVATLRQPA